MSGPTDADTVRASVMFDLVETIGIDRYDALDPSTRDLVDLTMSLAITHTSTFIRKVMETAQEGAL